MSLFTTSAARLLLFDAMDIVENTPGSKYIGNFIKGIILGCEVLYTDTDSIIYAAEPENNPLKTGKFLGEFTNEYPEHDIIEYNSSGPKQYLLDIVKNGILEHVMKIRGIR